MKSAFYAYSTLFEIQYFGGETTMATYNYICGQCNKKFSISISMMNKPPDSALWCPTCHVTGTVKRIYDKFSFVLKSPGFYSTDNKNE